MITKQWVKQQVETLGWNQKITNKLTNALNVIVDDYYRVANKCTDELYKEAWKMYDSFIDQFYSYQTRSYIRHGYTSPGVGGINLYRAQDITLMDDIALHQFTINFDYRAMEGGPKYKIHNRKDVLNYVMSGYRFKFKKHDTFLDITWTGSYKGRYFSTDGESTIDEAYDKFIAEYPSMYNQLFEKEWKGYGYK